MNNSLCPLSPVKSTINGSGKFSLTENPVFIAVDMKSYLADIDFMVMLEEMEYR